MKYLVHRETKEHIRYHEDSSLPLAGWEIVDADDDGWIPWSADECPLPRDCVCEIKTRLEKEYDTRLAKMNLWDTTTHYRPVLLSASKPTLEETWHEIEKHSKVDVFARLSSAVSASGKIPALIAEINAMLPDGYCVTRKAQIMAEPAEDMSDWRNWRAGDIVQCISQPAEHGPRWFTVGNFYVIRRIDADRPRMVSNFPTDLSNNPSDFKFHSRPVTIKLEGIL